MRIAENTRPGGQILRYPGFTQPQASQQPPAASTQSRTTLGSSRLQSTSSKLGSAATWGLNNAASGIAGRGTTNSRQLSAGPSSFTQVLSGGAASNSLDMSEFPSLSGNSQNQLANSTQSAIWQQKPAAQPPSNAGSTQQHGQRDAQPRQNNASSSNDDIFPNQAHLSGKIDGLQGGPIPNHSRPGQSTDQASTNADDFPPLGRNAFNDPAHSINPFREYARRDSSQTQRNLVSGLAQIDGAQPGARGENSLDSSVFQDRPGLHNSEGNQQDSGHRGFLFSGFDQSTATSNTSSQHIPRSRQSQHNYSQHPSNHPPSFDLKTRPRNSPNNPIRSSDPTANFHDTDPSKSSPPTDKISAAQRRLSTQQQYGIGGLLAKIRSEDPVISSLTRGQDLNQLGLDLRSPDLLWPTWTGPFADPGARPFQPDFSLPDCYTVTNVHRVRDKLPGFSDETLFWIFFTQTQDILQDMAAAELTSRNWRYHKQLQMWLTKDPALPEPRRISDEMETGSYVFWNQREWARVRQADFVLEYALLAPTNLRANGGGTHIPMAGNGNGVV